MRSTRKNKNKGKEWAMWLGRKADPGFLRDGRDQQPGQNLRPRQMMMMKANAVRTYQIFLNYLVGVEHV